MSETIETDDSTAAIQVALVDEDLLRCVPPAFVDVDHSMDEPSPNIFRPRPEDAGKLSVDRGSLRTPEESYLHRRDVLKLRTAGVLSVSTDDLSEIDLEAFAESVPENTAHAFIDLRHRLEDKRLREVLLIRALKHGWRFIPE